MLAFSGQKIDLEGAAMRRFLPLEFLPRLQKAGPNLESLDRPGVVRKLFVKEYGHSRGGFEMKAARVFVLPKEKAFAAVCACRALRCYILCSHM
jgi:hypothetical protein